MKAVRDICIWNSDLKDVPSAYDKIKVFSRQEEKLIDRLIHRQLDGATSRGWCLEESLLLVLNAKN